MTTEDVRENYIAREIVDAAYKIDIGLGPGLLETVYEKVLSHQLQQKGLTLVIKPA